MKLQLVKVCPFVSCSGADASRPLPVTLIKYGLTVAIFLAFIMDIVLLSCGPSLVDDYMTPHKSEMEIKCLKSIWTAFLSLNLFFFILGFVGVFLEKISCVFLFTIYMFFVSFGTFFDTVSKNHFAALGLMIVTLMSLVFGVILRIERLAPEPSRKFSVISNYKA